MKKFLFFLFCALSGAGLLSGKDKCVILSGQNNHDWTRTTPVLKTIIELGGVYDVEINNSPENMTAGSLDGVKLVVSNWNGLGTKKWSDEAFKVYEDFVNNGGGVVSIHAGTTYPDAKESYRKIGIGTWTGKTFHGPYSSFKVKVQDVKHPVMKGVNDFVTRDELWSNVEFTGEYKVLASAVAIGSPYIERILGKESKANSVLQPSVVAAEIGNGRCVTIFLGHNEISMGKAEFMDIFANASLWVAGKNVAGGFVNSENIASIVSEIARMKENGNMSLMISLERFALNADAKTRSKIVSLLLEKIISNASSANYFKRRAWDLAGNIATKSDAFKISQFLNVKESSEFASQALEKIKYKADLSKPAVIEFKKFDASRIKSLLEKYDSLNNSQKIVALARFYYADYKPALDVAKSEIKNPDSDVSLNALRTAAKLASARDYPFFCELLKNARSAQEKRTIMESAMQIDNSNFDAVKALQNADDEDFSFYADIALVQNSDKAIPAILGRLGGETIDAKNVLNALMPYADKSNIKSILSIYGRSSGIDSALTQALVNFMRRDIQNFEIVKSAFDSFNEAVKQKVLFAFSVCASPEIFDYVLSLADSNDKKLSDMASEAIMSWRSVSPVMKIVSRSKIGGKPSAEFLYAILNGNKRAALSPNEIMVLSKIFSEQKDPKYAELSKRLGEVFESARPRGEKNIVCGASIESIKKYGVDGAGGPPRAAIDGDNKTYWDELDGKGIYGLKITLSKKEKLSQIRIFRYSEDYSPDGFQVFVDGKKIKNVGYAIYKNNNFNLDVDAEGRCVEIIIDSVPEGKSPAIRELEIY